MTSRHFLPLIALGGALVASGVRAQTPLPPSIAAETRGDTAPAKKPAPKSRPAAVKPADGTAPARAAAKPVPARGYSETLPLARRIDPDDIVDPFAGRSGPGGSRVRPTMTPSGRPGLGGRF
jgi:hypothetical protein